MSNSYVFYSHGVGVFAQLWNCDESGFLYQWVAPLSPWIGESEHAVSKVQHIQPRCQHKWKTTYGLFQEYRDCELCSAKWEDIHEEGV